MYKPDKPLILIYSNGVFVCSTRSHKTCTDARNHYVNIYPDWLDVKAIIAD